MQYYIFQIHDHSVAEIGELGDFRIVKYYDIYKTSKSTKPCNVDGIIVQKVTRTTQCKSFDDSSHLITNAEIDAFTDGHVLNSNSSYYEYFVVKHGQSVDGDAFASGAITKYSKHRPILTNIPYKNGETSYLSKSVFIHKDNINYLKIKCFNWNMNPKSPANGLPFIIECDESNKLFQPIFLNRMKNKYKNSNIVFHKLNATWSKNNTITKITQTM
jgi:hypothetical protein